MYVRVCLHMHVFILNVCMYIRFDISGKNRYVCMHVYVCVCIYVRVYVHTHVYVYVCKLGSTYLERIGMSGGNGLDSAAGA